jgi:cold shock CspA family protein
MLHGMSTLFYASLFESLILLFVRNDNGQDIYAHFTSVAKKNPKHRLRSLGDGELVRFNIVDTAKGQEAIEITGPDGEPVIGSEYAIPSNRRREPPITESQRGRVPRNGRAESRRAPPPQQNYDDQQIQSPRRRRPIPRRSESGGVRLNDDGMGRPINRRRGPPMNPRNNYAPNPYNNNNFYNNDEPLYYTFKPSNFEFVFFYNRALFLFLIKRITRLMIMTDPDAFHLIVT